ncbi:MAG: hypothetical protein CSA75_04875, partial [Sorangium cellulosum]
MKNSRWFASGIVIAAVSSVSLVPAQTKLEGFSVNSFDPSDRDGDWFVNESLDFRNSMKPAFGVVFDYARRPLVFHQNDQEIGVPITDQLTVHVGGSLVLMDRVSVGLSMPVVLRHDGESGRHPRLQFQSDSGTAAGDLRMSGKVRLFGNYGETITGAAGLALHLPTGRQDVYASDGTVRVEPRLMVAGDGGPVTYAGYVGIQFRPRNEDYLNHAFGSTMTFGVSAGARLLDNKLIVGPELYGWTVVSDGGDGFFKERTTPVDLLFGGHYQPNEDWRMGVGAGPGLTRGWGSPDYRVVASVQFAPSFDSSPPPPAPSDRDHDGIVDSDDACPDEAGVPNTDSARHGCPAPVDRDMDTIVDGQDACPEVAGPSNPDPTKNGCPTPSDRDADGIFDEQDACPETKGVASSDPKKNGCPEDTDRDKDRIANHVDACPDQAGPASADPEKNGCPKAIIVGEAIQINERVEFDTGKATLRPESDALLIAVVSIL